MNESEFNQCIEKTLLQIEGNIDGKGVDINNENFAGTLNLHFSGLVYE